MSRSFALERTHSICFYMEIINCSECYIQPAKSFDGEAEFLRTMGKRLRWQSGIFIRVTLRRVVGGLIPTKEQDWFSLLPGLKTSITVRMKQIKLKHNKSHTKWKHSLKGPASTTKKNNVPPRPGRIPIETTTAVGELSRVSLRLPPSSLALLYTGRNLELCSNKKKDTSKI